MKIKKISRDHGATVCLISSVFLAISAPGVEYLTDDEKDPIGWAGGEQSEPAAASAGPNPPLNPEAMKIFEAEIAYNRSHEERYEPVLKECDRLMTLKSLDFGQMTALSGFVKTALGRGRDGAAAPFVSQFYNNLLPKTKNSMEQPTMEQKRWAVATLMSDIGSQCSTLLIEDPGLRAFGPFIYNTLKTGLDKEKYPKTAEFINDHPNLVKELELKPGDMSKVDHKDIEAFTIWENLAACTLADIRDTNVKAFKGADAFMHNLTTQHVPRTYEAEQFLTERLYHRATTLRRVGSAVNDPKQSKAFQALSRRMIPKTAPASSLFAVEQEIKRSEHLNLEISHKIDKDVRRGRPADGLTTIFRMIDQSKTIAEDKDLPKKLKKVMTTDTVNFIVEADPSVFNRYEVAQLQKHKPTWETFKTELAEAGDDADKTKAVMGKFMPNVYRVLAAASINQLNDLKPELIQRRFAGEGAASVVQELESQLTKLTQDTELRPSTLTAQYAQLSEIIESLAYCVEVHKLKDKVKASKSKNVVGSFIERLDTSSLDSAVMSFFQRTKNSDAKEAEHRLELLQRAVDESKALLLGAVLAKVPENDLEKECNKLLGIGSYVNPQAMGEHLAVLATADPNQVEDIKNDVEEEDTSSVDRKPNSLSWTFVGISGVGTAALVAGLTATLNQTQAQANHPRRVLLSGPRKRKHTSS